MGEQVRELVAWASRRKLLATLFVILTLAAGVMIGTVISGRVSAMKNTGPLGGSKLTIPEPAQLSNSFAGVVEQVAPAVVNISTTQVLNRQRSRRRPAPNEQQEDPFQDYFDRFFGGGQDGPATERSLGSGVIVDKRGYILTNNHVVDQATKIQVQLNKDSTKYTAKVVGVDEETDLAVIKIETNQELPTAKLGNSDGVRVGDWVLAIGSPFGLNATVTAGIISAKDRGGVGIGRQFQRFIQTDAAINPGNSGGPLIDLAGEVIGINTAIITGSRGYEGVGFALPSNTAINVYNQIVEKGRVTRGSIGVRFSEEIATNPITLKQLGAPYGIILEDVEPGSPAEEAGLKADDVITQVNGKAVRTGNDLVNPIAQSAIGSKMKLTYIRDGKEKEATATVADRTKVFPDRAGRVSDQHGGTSPSEFGLRVEEFTPARASRVGMDYTKGVLVASVEPASFAEDLGFVPGDIITEINRESILNVEAYRKIAARLKTGQSVVFRVLRRTPQDSDRTLHLYLSGIIPADNQ